MHTAWFPAVLIVSLLASSSILAENWPGWRGPRHDGTSQETNLPIEFGADKNLAWKHPLPGAGGATPVVWEDRIYVTSVEGNAVVLLALSTEGKQLWSRTIADKNQDVRSDEGNSASPSPSTDGQLIFAMSATGALACFDRDGKIVWEKELGQEYGPLNIQFGMTSTPLLVGDRLYVQLMFTGGNYLIALDKQTGKQIFWHKRQTDAVAECEHAYTSPTLYQDGTQKFLVLHGSDYVTGHDLETGKELWRCGNLNPAESYNRTLRFVASPVATPGHIVVPTAKKGKVISLKPADLVGNVTAKTDAYHWVMPRNTPDVPSPLVHGGLCYLVREDGTLNVVDANTGEEKFAERLRQGRSERHRASPVMADGHLYICSRDSGTVVVVKAGPTLEVAAVNTLGSPITASPAISNGKLYIRTFDALYAFEKR